MMRRVPRSISLLTLASILLIAIILVIGYAVASFTSLTVLLYASIVVSRLLKGPLVPALSTSLKLLSVPTFLTLLPTWAVASPFLGSISYSLLLGALVYSGLLIVNSLAVNYQEIAYPLSRSVFLALMGLVLWNLSNQIQFSQIGVKTGVNYVILVSFLGSASLSSFDVLRKHQSRVVSIVATFLSRDLALRSIVLLLTSSYLFVGRGVLMNNYPNVQSYLMVAEWVTLSVIVFRSYWSFKGFIEKKYVEHDELEKWSRHTQNSEWATDQRMKSVSDAIQEFLDRGVKDLIIVYLIGLMRDAGELDNSIASSLSPLIDYVDLHPSVIFHESQEMYIEEKNRKRRLTIFAETISQLRKIGLKLQLPEDVFPLAQEGEFKRT
jgi:hypothetical protein